LTRRKVKKKQTKRRAQRKRRTVRKKRTQRRTQRKRRSARKSKSKKKAPFGGYGIDFTNCQETLEDVFGNKPVSPPQMTKLIWQYIKRKRIARKP
jgi:chromatin remodeling complex protein RSC6